MSVIITAFQELTFIVKHCPFTSTFVAHSLSVIRYEQKKFLWYAEHEHQKRCAQINFHTEDAAGLRGTISSMSDARARGHMFDTWSSHILLFLFLLIQEGHLLVTGKSIHTKYWLTT